MGSSLRALTALRQSTSKALAGLRAALSQAGLQGDPDVSDALQSTALRWQTLDGALSSLADQRDAALYIDGTTGSQLSGSGRAMKSVVDRILISDAQNLRQMGVDMSRLGTILRSAVADSGLRLRGLLMGGSALAAVMLALMLYYAWRSRLARGAAVQAERQVADILGTVREGLFLVDRQMRLSPTHSDSLRAVLRLPTPGGLRVQELLEPLVDAKTISATLKYLGLLWKDKVHEDLIESVNPLSEIEVAFAEPRGGAEAPPDVLLPARTLRPGRW